MSGKEQIDQSIEALEDASIRIHVEDAGRNAEALLHREEALGKAIVKLVDAYWEPSYIDAVVEDLRFKKDTFPVPALRKPLVVPLKRAAQVVNDREISSDHTLIIANQPSEDRKSRTVHANYLVVSSEDSLVEEQSYTRVMPVAKASIWVAKGKDKHYANLAIPSHLYDAMTKESLDDWIEAKRYLSPRRYHEQQIIDPKAAIWDDLQGTFNAALEKAPDKYYALRPDDDYVRGEFDIS